MTHCAGLPAQVPCFHCPHSELAYPQARTAEGEAFGKFPKHPQWKFTFVNHVTTNPFFVPTRYGAEDACALLGCTYQWTGSEKSIATDMVNALDTAVSADVDGIAVCLVDQTAFNDPVEKALKAGIPVVSYNADSQGNKRLCYIGQDLFVSGKGLGQRIVELVPEGEVVGFIATPGQLNIQPRLNGAKRLPVWFRTPSPRKSERCKGRQLRRQRLSELSSA